MIQAFECNLELAWNLVKDYYEYQGVTGIQGSHDAFRLAFNRGLLKDGENWMKMVESRTRTSHTYNEETADEIAEAIMHKYFAMFKELQRIMEEISTNEE